MGKLWCIWVLLCVRIGDCLVKRSPHSYMIREIGGKTPVKICRTGLKMCCESPILHRQVVIFFLVHLFVDYILLCDSQRATRSAFVDLRRTARRFDSGFKTSVTSP